MENTLIFLFIVQYQEVHILPDKLKNSVKGLINIKSDNKCFLWCHIRHLNPLNKNPQRITTADKTIASILIIKILSFLCPKKITAISKKKISALIYFIMKIT